MVVILSDDEAENVAAVLRRMAERVADSDDARMAFVDDRGPTDFANQLEALVDAGDETVYVPFERGDDALDGTTARRAFVTESTAHMYAATVNDADVDRTVPHAEAVTVADPNDDLPDP